MNTPLTYGTPDFARASHALFNASKGLTLKQFEELTRLATKMKDK